LTDIDLHPTACAICGTEGNAAELYPANFKPEDFSPEVFSARRLPDRIHYRMVRCHECGLVRSDPVADPAAVAKLYQQSSFDYSTEVDNLASTYGSYLARLDRYGVNRQAILEIGCGNGFFLKRALAQGYRDVRGVEPSAAAIELAPDEIRSGIVCAMMGPGLFPDRSFDAICLFQVLDHVFDPAALIRVCFQLLKPGGFILCLNHNVEALSARIMKERSPIVDIEHTYLYSPGTMTRLFSGFGFDVKEIATVRNLYSVGYVTRLVPIPASLKKALLALLDATGIGRIRVGVPLGNLCLIARKPPA
jgi:SAM-dependent methyltransferase